MHRRRERFRLRCLLTYFSRLRGLLAERPLRRA